MEFVRYCIRCGAEKRYKNLESFLANKDSLLCRSCSKRESFKNRYPNEIEKLLEDTPETYYWIGFLLSDGHIDGEKRIIFSQNGEDTIAVERFAKYIGLSDKVKYTERKARISVMNTDIVGKLVKKFDIKSDKTFNPPDKNIFKNMNTELLSYLFVGFVDGDGHIGNFQNRNDFNLRIKVHSSWFDILCIISEKIFGNKNYVKINNQGYAELVIGDSRVLKRFKKMYVSNSGLEVLSRKWDIIDLNFIGKYELSETNFDNIKKLYEKGYTAKEICKELSLKEGLVYKDIRKIKNSQK